MRPLSIFSALLLLTSAAFAAESTNTIKIYQLPVATEINDDADIVVNSSTNVGGTERTSFTNLVSRIAARGQLTTAAQLNAASNAAAAAAASKAPTNNATIHASGPDSVPLTLRAAVGQDADMLVVRDSGGNVMFSIGYDGVLSGGGVDSVRLSSTSTAGHAWIATDTTGLGAFSAIPQQTNASVFRQTQATALSNAIVAQIPSAISGTNNPIKFSGGTLALIANQTSRHQHSTNESFAWAIVPAAGASNQSSAFFAEFENVTTNTIVATNVTGFYGVSLGSNAITTHAIAPMSKLLIDAYLNVSNQWVIRAWGAEYEFVPGSGMSWETNHSTRRVTANVTGGTGSTNNTSLNVTNVIRHGVTNVIVSTTGKHLLDLSRFSVFNLLILTNALLEFTNWFDGFKDASVTWQQDSNGQRLVNWSVAGGTFQTNAAKNYNGPTNADAISAMIVRGSLFSSNISVVSIETNLFPRGGFTNSLADATAYPATISGILQFNYGAIASGAPGTAISTWEATTGNDLTGPTGSTRPTVETNLVAGKAIKVIRFDGVDDYLTNKFTTTATQPFAMFSTYRIRTLSSAAPTAQRIWDSAFGETPRNILDHSVANQINAYNGTFRTLGDSLTNWLITVLIVDGANTRMSTNGSAWLVVPGSVGTDNPTGVTLAIDKGGVSLPAQANYECFGVIANTNTATWFANLTNWMHGRLY